MFSASVFFVLGFTAVFAVLGVLLNTLLEAVAYDVLVWAGRIAGLVIVFFGLYLLGLFKIPALEKERRVSVHRFRSPSLTSFLFGAAFAAGWTPCVGAVLGSILGLAATSPGFAFTLLVSYAIGFGVPFLLVGLFESQATGFISRHSRTFSSASRLFGLVLVLFGILMFTQSLARFASVEFLQELFQ
jgi:cytochrome c-type biogenesis protein